MALLIDTSVFIQVERQSGLVSDIGRLVPDAVHALSSVTAFKLLFGVHRATRTHRARREAFVERALAAIPVMPFDLAAARIYASVWETLRSQGQIIGSQDLMIAATALAHGYEVLTENRRDFDRVPGLIIRQPIWPAEPAT